MLQWVCSVILRSKNASKCGKNISDLFVWVSCMCHFAVFTTVIYYWTDVWQHGIYLLKVLQSAMIITNWHSAHPPSFYKGITIKAGWCCIPLCISVLRGDNITYRSNQNIPDQSKYGRPEALCLVLKPPVDTPYDNLYREAPPVRGTIFRLQLYKRVGILLVEVYERVRKSVIWVCKRAERG